MRYITLKQNKTKQTQKLPGFSGVDHGKCNRALSNLFAIIPPQFSEWESFSWSWLKKKFQARPHFYGWSLKLSECDARLKLCLMSYGAMTRKEMYLNVFFGR